MPYLNEHSCRLKNPDDFKEDSFVRVSRDHEGKKYDVIRGKLKENDEWADQAFRYPKETWTESEARKHCKAHDGILFEPASGEDTLEDYCCGNGAAKNKDHKPIRCFEGSAEPYEPFWKWNVANAAESGETLAEPELELNGYISEFSWWGDEITPKLFKDELYRYGKGGPVTIRMNSHGGDVIAASLISTMIKDYPGRVTVQIDGMAASAATVVAVAGDRVRMQETAYFMIHDPLAVFFFAMLNIEELSRMVDSLKAVKEGIINTYVTKTGLSRSRLGSLMTNETWMDAQKAVDLGFVDEVIKGSSKNALIPVENAAMVNALRNYMNVPATLLAPAKPAPEEPVSVNPVAERLRAEAKIFKKE